MKRERSDMREVNPRIYGALLYGAHLRRNQKSHIYCLFGAREMTSVFEFICFAFVEHNIAIT